MGLSQKIIRRETALDLDVCQKSLRRQASGTPDHPQRLDSNKLHQDRLFRHFVPPAKYQGSIPCSQQKT